LIGTIVSHYELRERLAGGGFGTVYKAWDLDRDRFAALRLIPPRLGHAADRRRLLREASALAAACAAEPPYLGAVYEAGETAQGEIFLVTAWCEGETLERRLERGPLRPAAAADFAAQIAAGLAAIHRLGVVHRNLRPSNVFLTAGGQVKIVDFGLPGVGEQTLFDGGAELPVSASSYASPEQLSGETPGALSDLWSLGAVLHEMITGRRPSPLTHPEPLRALQPDAPVELERIVARATAPRPADRYGGAEEMRRDLLTLHSLPTTTAPPPPPEAPVDPVRTVGPYRLLERIGGGGMGIIWRAEDTRLGRIVALKLLPPALSRDSVSKARFQQESRAASTLDHPNVCALYDVGETVDGQLFLTMPCYEGETLRQRLERGPLAVDAAIDVARQVARGLAEAHRRGIVHRDIKPANLMLTGDGMVKILDFGIAKLAGAVGLTRTGSTVGTLAYMSPEQMRGRPVDPRIDLWALGVVLYEMLAGRRPFTGDSDAAQREAILTAAPEPLRALRPEVPPEVERIVAGLLAKDPEKRYPSADRLLADLNGIGAIPPASALPPAPRKLRRWLAAAAVAAVATAAASLWLLGRSPSRPAPLPAAVPLRTTFTLLTDQEGRETFPSLSPDGEYFVYVRRDGGDDDLFLQRIGGGRPIPLTADSPADDSQPSWSPSGDQIVFRSERDGGGLFLMGATGESVRRLTDFGFNPAWSPDGKEIVFATERIADPVLRQSDSRLWRVEVASHRLHPVATGDAVQPSWSPHGLRLAYWGRSHEGAQRILWTAAPDGSRPVRVVEDTSLSWDPVWSPDGRFLYYASDRSGSMSLWRVPIDEAAGRALGEPEPVPTPSPWSGLLSLSRDGRRIVYAIDESKANIERAVFDPDRAILAGPFLPVTQGSRSVRSAAPSPDGQWIAFDTSAPREDLFLVRPDGGDLRRLTDDAAKDRIPRWSPDGGRLLFYSNRSGKYEAWTIGADGSGLRQETQIRGEPLFDPFWSPDGRRIAGGLGFRGPAVIDLDRPIAGRRPEPLALLRPATFSVNDWSPDGGRLIGTDESDELVVYTFRTRGLERLGVKGQGAFWLADGQRALFRQGRDLWVLDIRTRQARRILTPPPGAAILAARPSADGRSLYIVRAVEEGNIGMISLP
jgi:serine/threonine protein kinase/Tol biopolymer transport system component